MTAQVYLCETSYGRWIEESERRYRRGERQTYCSVHGGWHWPSEESCCDTPKMTERQFNRMVKDSEREVLEQRVVDAKVALRRLR